VKNNLFLPLQYPFHIFIGFPNFFLAAFQSLLFVFLSSFFLPLVHDKTVPSPLFFRSSTPLSPSLFSIIFLSYPFYSSVCPRWTFSDRERNWVLFMSGCFNCIFFNKDVIFYALLHLLVSWKWLFDLYTIRLGLGYLHDH
jgi:hypothetical protein